MAYLFPDDESEAPSSIIGASKRHAERHAGAAEEGKMRERRIDSIEKTSRRKRKGICANWEAKVESELDGGSEKGEEARQARVRDVLAEQLTESTLDALIAAGRR